MVKHMSKAQLRHNILAQRSSRLGDNARLIAEVCRYIEDRQAHTVAAYVPTATEPGGGLPLIDALATATDTLYLPAIAAHHQLHWGSYTSGDVLAQGHWGIPEPSQAPHTNNILATCDLVLVPGLACSPAGVRLGRGGGYYDRALAHVAGLSGVAVELGVLLHPWEVLSEVPFEPHDIRMDLIFTSEGTVRCSRNV